MDDLDLHNLLDEGAPEAGHDVLARIVRRHGRLRVRRARLAASAAVVVALAAAGTGIGLSSSPGHTLATGGAVVPSDTGRAPGGLAWARPSTGRPAASATPGVFGWLASPEQVTSSSRSATSNFGLSEVLPSAALVAPAAGRYMLAVCTTRGCGPIYVGESSKRLFARTVDGVTIQADLVRYDLPTGRMQPQLPVTGAVGGGQTGGGVTPQPAHSSTTPLVRVSLPCLSPSELIVTVSQGRSRATLAVPGADSTRPFSVVASASAELGGDDIVLAVARSGTSVRTVTSQFPGGGEDHMSPVGGWSVLVHRTHRPGGLSAAGAVTLVATSASGRTLEEVKLPVTGSLATTTFGTCQYWVASGTSASSPPGSSTGSSAGSSTGSSPPAASSPPGSSTGSSVATGQSG